MPGERSEPGFLARRRRFFGRKSLVFGRGTLKKYKRVMTVHSLATNSRDATASGPSEETSTTPPRIRIRLCCCCGCCCCCCCCAARRAAPPRQQHAWRGQQPFGCDWRHLLILSAYARGVMRCTACDSTPSAAAERRPTVAPLRAWKRLGRRRQLGFWRYTVFYGGHLHNFLWLSQWRTRR